MVPITGKAKQFGVFIVKLLVVIAAFYFICVQLSATHADWATFRKLVWGKASIGGILFILFLSVANRLLEILKWQNLACCIRPITLGESTKQVLAALTAGIFTPNGLGEYAGKALFYEKEKAGQVVFLNLVCNGIQMILTIFFGLLGLLLLGYQEWVLLLVLAGLLLGMVVYFSGKIKVKGYSLQNLWQQLWLIPKTVHRKNILLGCLRYLVFSHQYYFLFLAFGVDLPYITLMAAIASVYFLASSLPNFQFMDFAVKGSVALFFFGKLGVGQWAILFISTLMWLLNVVLPVVIGSYFVLTFRLKKTLPKDKIEH